MLEGRQGYYEMPVGHAAVMDVLQVMQDHELGGDVAERHWPMSLDVESLLSSGWRPSPFRQFIIKLQGRCNLACDYCYVYALADQTWRTRPRTMSPGIVSIVAGRIAEHAQRHDLAQVGVIFHGGEPLLAGPSPVIDALRKIRASVDARTRVDSWIQTNGTLLDEQALDALESVGVRIGVSVDGDISAHDRSRRYADGRGSHGDVTRGLRLLMVRQSIYSGLLSVVDLDSDPIATYDALLAFKPPAISFLLPHGNWSSPPPGRHNAELAPYAEWLIEIFDRWYDAPVKETQVRLFEEIIHLLLGGTSATEAVGLTPTSLIVVETDGSIEQSDAIKSAYDGAAATGLHVARDCFDDALELPQIAARQIGVHALSEQCLSCRVKKICGGGLYAHRYNDRTGFRNPSVYCRDLYSLIMHIRRRLSEDLRTASQHGQKIAEISTHRSSLCPSAAALVSG